jgi:hypothetical protein
MNDVSRYSCDSWSGQSQSRRLQVIVIANKPLRFEAAIYFKVNSSRLSRTVQSDKTEVWNCKNISFSSDEQVEGDIGHHGWVQAVYNMRRLLAKHYLAIIAIIAVLRRFNSFFNGF